MNEYEITYNPISNYFIIVRHVYKGVYQDQDGRDIHRYGSIMLLDTRPQEIIDRIKKAKESGDIIIPSINTKEIKFSVDSDKEAVYAVFYFIFQKPEMLRII